MENRKKKSMLIFVPLSGQEYTGMGVGIALTAFAGTFIIGLLFGVILSLNFPLAQPDNGDHQKSWRMLFRRRHAGTSTN